MWSPSPPPPPSPTVWPSRPTGDLVFPYVQKNVDRVLAIEDSELVEAFLDVMERHKMVVENAGLLTVAALRHLDCQTRDLVWCSPGAIWT